MAELLDARGVPIAPGDSVKFFRFSDTYKVCRKCMCIIRNNDPHAACSHMEMYRV